MCARKASIYDKDRTNVFYRFFWISLFCFDVEKYVLRFRLKVNFGLVWFGLVYLGWRFGMHIFTQIIWWIGFFMAVDAFGKFWIASLDYLKDKQ